MFVCRLMFSYRSTTYISTNFIRKMDLSMISTSRYCFYSESFFFYNFIMAYFGFILEANKYACKHNYDLWEEPKNRSSILAHSFPFIHLNFINNAAWHRSRCFKIVNVNHVFMVREKTLFFLLKLIIALCERLTIKMQTTKKH